MGGESAGAPVPQGAQSSRRGLPRARALGAVVAALVATNAFLFVFFPPYAAQFQPPLGPPREELPSPNLEAIAWRDARFTTAQQGGSLYASQRGDIDGDGAPELVAVGSYGLQVGLLVVYDIDGPRPVEKANLTWPQLQPWGIKSVLLRPVDGQPGAEVIVGGALFQEDNLTHTAVQVFTWRTGALARLGGAFALNQYSDSVVHAVLPPFVGHGPSEVFQTLSTAYEAQFHTPRTALTTWRTNATGGLEPGNATKVDAEARDGAALVCPACNGSAAAVGVIGSGLVQVFVPDALEGPTLLYELGAPGFFWQSCAWLGEGTQWEFVALGQGYATLPAGLATFVMNVTLTGARVGAYVPSSFDVPFRFSDPVQVPEHISRPWTRANGTARELSVVLFTASGNGQVTSTAYRARYERGATPISGVAPAWATHNAIVYDIADMPATAGGRMAYVGAANNEPALMMEG